MLTAAGCSDAGYALYAVSGQFDLVSRMRSVQEVLDDGSLSEAQQEKMHLLLAIRDFAAKDLALNVGDSYTTYLHTGGDPVANNLSASAQDSFPPVPWCFPLAGTVPYLGFFHRPEADAYQTQLVDAGYDTVLYGVEAYSTLGLFPDPITTSMLERSEAFLVDLLVHESTHNTVWRANDTDFNENAASFVARAGTMIYLTQKYGPDSDVVRDTEHAYSDGDLYDAYLSDLYGRLRAFYASDLMSDEKIEGRVAIFEEAKQRLADEVLPKMYRPEGFEWTKSLNINNAWILSNARYSSDLSAFQGVYDATGHDFAASLQIFKDATQAADAIAYLNDAAK